MFGAQGSCSFIRTFTRLQLGWTRQCVDEIDFVSVRLTVCEYVNRPHNSCSMLIGTYARAYVVVVFNV